MMLGVNPEATKMVVRVEDCDIGLYRSHIFLDIGLDLSYIPSIEALVILSELISRFGEIGMTS
jgi:hypothetical protein